MEAEICEFSLLVMGLGLLCPEEIDGLHGASVVMLPVGSGSTLI